MITELKACSGAVYPVRDETDHYILCGAPTPATQTSREALLDFEDLYKQGYRLCTVHNSFRGPTNLFFEKIHSTILRDLEAGRGSRGVLGVKQS